MAPSSGPRNIEAEKAATDGLKEIKAVMDSFKTLAVKVQLNYAHFIHTPEFKSQYAASSYKCLGVGLVDPLQSLATSLKKLCAERDTKPYVKSIKLFLVTLDATSTAEYEPSLQWNEENKIMTIVHSFKTFNHPASYSYTSSLVSILTSMRTNVDSDVIATIDKKIATVVEELRAVHSSLLISFDWKQLQTDPTCQSNAAYVARYFQLVPDRIRTALFHKNTHTEYDSGLLDFVTFEGLVLQNVAEIIFHMSAGNKINSQGKFGYFTPYGYDATIEGKTLHISFNEREYPVGVGSLIEWLLNPSKAQERQQTTVNKLAARNHEEELARREKLLAEDRNARVAFAELSVTYQRDLEQWKAMPERVSCFACAVTGHVGRNILDVHQCVQREGSGKVHKGHVEPIPPKPLPDAPPLSFSPCTIDDFKTGLDRVQLRCKHV